MVVRLYLACAALHWTPNMNIISSHAFDFNNFESRRFLKVVVCVVWIYWFSNVTLTWQPAMWWYGTPWYVIRGAFLVMFWKKNGNQNPVNGGYICTASSQIQGARMISIHDSICALALAGCWEAGWRPGIPWHAVHYTATNRCLSEQFLGSYAQKRIV